MTFHNSITTYRRKIVLYSIRENHSFHWVVHTFQAKSDRKWLKNGNNRKNVIRLFFRHRAKKNVVPVTWVSAGRVGRSEYFFYFFKLFFYSMWGNFLTTEKNNFLEGILPIFSTTFFKYFLIGPSHQMLAHYSQKSGEYPPPPGSLNESRIKIISLAFKSIWWKLL